MKLISKYFIILVAFTLTQSIATAQTDGKAQTNFLLRFRNVVGKQDLKLNDNQYTNAAGEKFNITTFNYYVSNIKFQRKDGSEYVLPQDSTYYLVKETDPTSREINLRLPASDYTAVSFIIGVDSVMSTSDLTHRTGALDISGGMLDGMYWTWNSGYLFVKLEGDSEQAKVDMTGQHKFRYHIGGYGGYKKPSLNNIKKVSLGLTGLNAGDAKGNGQVTINIQADVLKIFDGPKQLRIADNSNVMFGDQSKVVADNYSRMFSIVSTEPSVHEKN
jgi:hypothetical protein